MTSQAFDIMAIERRQKFLVSSGHRKRTRIAIPFLAVCVIAVVAPAPCQCCSPAGNHTPSRLPAFLDRSSRSLGPIDRNPAPCAPFLSPGASPFAQHPFDLDGPFPTSFLNSLAMFPRSAISPIAVLENSNSHVTGVYCFPTRPLALKVETISIPS